MKLQFLHSKNTISTKNHYFTAHELFYDSGPLAILPMKKLHKHLFSQSIEFSIKHPNSDILLANV